MDGNPVLQIVRCRLGTEMEMDNQGYPFPMAAHSHSHSHLPHPPPSHAHFPRPHYPHPCGTASFRPLISLARNQPPLFFFLSSFLSLSLFFRAPFVHSCAPLLI